VGAHNANNDTMIQYHTQTAWQLAALYELFHFLWVVWFLSYFAYAAIAYVAAHWYFQRRAVSLSHGVWMILRYHVGSVAFAAATIAVVQFSQTLLLYLRSQCGAGQQTKKSSTQVERPTRRGGLPIASAASACCSCASCCLCCLDGILSSINKNGLVWMAYQGDSFMTSCGESFALVLRNIGLVTSVSLVSSISLGMTKLVVAALSSGICTVILVQMPYFVQRVNSPIAPAIVVFIVSYILASIVMIVVQSTMDTLFLCFVIDGESHAQVRAMTGRNTVRRAMRASLKQDFQKREQKAAASRGASSVTDVRINVV